MAQIRLPARVVLLALACLNIWMAPAWAETLLGAPVVQLQESHMVAEGVWFRSYTGSVAGGLPLVVNVVEADPTHPQVEVRPVLAEGGIASREPLSQMAARTGAVAGINGGFFSMAPPYLPVGNLMVEGKLEFAGEMWRTSLGFNRDRQPVWGFFQPGLSLEAGEQSFAVARLNQPYKPQGVSLYTAAWGDSTGTPPGTFELVVNSDGRLSGRGSGNTPIPGRGGYVLSFPAPLSGPDPPWGETARLVTANFGPWLEVEHLLTSGPLLVEGGRPVFQAAAEGFRGGILDPGPRSAIATTGKGTVLLVTVDGRQPGYSAGLTFEEMAQLLVELGAREAMALDGGGSTELWVDKMVVNRPSGGMERPLNNSLVVLSGVPVYLNGRRLFFEVPAQVTEGRTLVPLREIFEALGAIVEWRPASQEVVARRLEKELVLQVETTTAWLNGEPLALDVPARVVEGRTLVPLRLVGEALGVGVSWDPQRQRVDLGNRD